MSRERGWLRNHGKCGRVQNIGRGGWWRSACVHRQQLAKLSNNPDAHGRRRGSYRGSVGDGGGAQRREHRAVGHGALLPCLQALPSERRHPGGTRGSDGPRRRVHRRLGLLPHPHRAAARRAEAHRSRQGGRRRCSRHLVATASPRAGPSAGCGDDQPLGGAHRLLHAQPHRDGGGRGSEPR